MANNQLIVLYWHFKESLQSLARAGSLACWGLALSALGTTAVAQALAPTALAALLREGGYVLYVRHAATDHTQTDKDLSAAGVAWLTIAVQFGFVFGTVLISVTNLADLLNTARRGTTAAHRTGQPESDPDIDWPPVPPAPPYAPFDENVQFVTPTVDELYRPPPEPGPPFPPLPPL